MASSVADGAILSRVSCSENSQGRSPAVSTADRSRFAGMTLNERLFQAGLISEFDEAALSRDRAQMIAVLERVSLTPREAASVADQVLANPAKFGFSKDTTR